MEREDMLKAIITAKTSVKTDSFNSLNLQKVAAQTEGFVGKDLDVLVNRAIHHHFVSQSSKFEKKSF